MGNRHRPAGRAVRSSYIVIAACAAVAFVPPVSALAQAVSGQAGQASAPLNLDKIIVTGTAHKVTKMKSSISVSSLGASQIRTSGAVSAAEVLRNIPGVQSQSSGGESNANVTVRGLPISAGGSRYVLFEQDGLPVLDFGDIAFATPDSFLRVDGLLDQVQVVRGGSASTLATNAPGGIINFISKTGETKGGSVAVTTGLGFNENRLDFDYGGPIDANDRAEIAGFYRLGNGFRTAGTQVENGGQIHGNVTHTFDGGFIRLNFQYLDDHAPTNLPVPVDFSNGAVVPIPGIDPRTASFYSKYLSTDTTLTASNGRRVNLFSSGLAARTISAGMQFQKTFNNGIEVEDNFRYAGNSGNFLGIYPGNNGAAVIGTYASGPNAGQAFNGTAFQAVSFDTHLNDLSNIANDLKVSKEYDAGALGKFTPTVGFYVASQKLNLTWDFNQFLLTMSGNNPSLITSPGFNTSVGSGFGYCCVRNYNATYVTTSPYVDLGWAIDKFTTDLSVREDIQHANGNYNFASATGGGTGPAAYNPANQQSINYSVSHTSYSFGTNYEINHDLAVFGRYSDGVSFNADRIINSGTDALNGSAPIPINEVKQLEGGIKARYGNLSTFVTLFDAKTAESNYDVTTQVSSANKYDAYGAEFEIGYVYRGFRLAGGATYTHSRITSTNEGGVHKNAIPQRQADWIYQIEPSYTYGPFSFGGSAIGSTSSYGNDQNTVVMPGYVLVNLFAKYQITPKLSADVTANNLFDTIAYSEFDNINNTTGVTGAARAFDGRTVKATLRYQF